MNCTLRAPLLLAALALAPFWSGCLMYSGERTPNLVETENLPTVAGAPRIAVIFHHTHHLEGNEQGLATDLTYKEMKESFERVRDEVPFLANSSLEGDDAELVLDLDTEVAEKGKTAAMVSGLTLLLIPGFTSSDVIVRAELKSLGGETIGKYSATGEIKVVFQLFLLPLLPVVPFIAPGDDLYDDTFRDIAHQMAPDIEAYLATP